MFVRFHFIAVLSWGRMLVSQLSLNLCILFSDIFSSRRAQLSHDMLDNRLLFFPIVTKQESTRAIFMHEITE